MNRGWASNEDRPPTLEMLDNQTEEQKLAHPPDHKAERGTTNLKSDLFTREKPIANQRSSGRFTVVKKSPRKHTTSHQTRTN